MKNRGIGFGIFLLTIGIIWALISFKVISLSVFNSILTLWPLIFVVIGISIIFRNKPVVRALAWIAFLAVIVIYGYLYGDTSIGGNYQQSSNVSYDITAGTQRGELLLTLGGMAINMDSSTDKLLEASVTDKQVKNSIVTSGSKATVHFTKEHYNILNFEPDNYNGTFHLSPNIPWNMDLKMGAVAGNLDLTGLQVENLDAKMGAGDFTLKMGDKAKTSMVNIKAGASKVKFIVPQTSGVKISIDGLNGTNVDDLGWNKNGDTYTSPNYDSAASKIEIKCTVGAGNIEVVTQ